MMVHPIVNGKYNFGYGQPSLPPFTHFRRLQLIRYLEQGSNPFNDFLMVAADDACLVPENILI